MNEWVNERMKDWVIEWVSEWVKEWLNEWIFTKGYPSIGNQSIAKVSKIKEKWLKMSTS